MTGPAKKSHSKAWVAWVLVPAGLLIFAGANAHLVYVAVQSQPDCVEHLRAGGEGEGYRAATSAC
jgi:hypothetical protein